MTDSEIIKAMEICVSKREDDDCDKCPLCSPEEFIHCRFELAPVLNLIKRQQAEIERLHRKATDYMCAATVVKAAAIRLFADSLRAGRESNDPVVIAVDTALEMLSDGYWDI